MFTCPLTPQHEIETRDAKAGGGGSILGMDYVDYGSSARLKKEDSDFVAI